MLEIGLRRCRAAGLGRAAEPVIGARQRDRPVGDVGDAGEMLGRRVWIVEAAQRIPAGMEFGVGGVGRAFGGMRGGDPVGGLHVALVDQFARQHAALDPPGVGIDQRGAVASAPSA